MPRLDVVSNVLHGTLNRRSTHRPFSTCTHKKTFTSNRHSESSWRRRACFKARGGVIRRSAAAGRDCTRICRTIDLGDEPIPDPVNARLSWIHCRIHEEDGRTVIANLHDTARRYLIRYRDAQGRVVWWYPAQLTTGVARDIYGPA